MDAGYMDEDGYLYVLSRADDVINVAGHRISAGAIEEVSIADNKIEEWKMNKASTFHHISKSHTETSLIFFLFVLFAFPSVLLTKAFPVSGSPY